ncbi:uncharacterized protein EV420DRAFT_936741 [Desarmillaria tabescens]|uniref:REJ domain-containing protein n=1 Tax=Armillaria tabescens TaxID=1929756 RepID=A0AA39TNG3_ARMTA|nr:uncharacterized protein EV420DRAFT_936741 [Desarmillaria tabescens]KAK0465057.1 hypothetical protein EV420DRAFT_936741 [Desarmillaria tabescens]
MSSGAAVQADMSSAPVSTSVTDRTTQAATTTAPVAAPPNTDDSTSSTSTTSSSSSSEVAITTSSSSTAQAPPPSTNTVTSTQPGATQPGATVTTTEPGTTNGVPTTSVTASATNAETPFASAQAVTTIVTEQSGTSVTGSSNNDNGDSSDTLRTTGIAALSVNSAASTTSLTAHSTLPQAVGLTVTGSDGQTSVTFPSFITVLSTATESDGTVVTESAVVSNPTGLGQPDKSSDSSFFSNTSAVAGTFAAVGIVVFAVLALLFVCYRRRRRQRSRTRWLEAITQPPSYPLHDDADRDPFEEDDPFEDPRSPPQMAQVTNTPQTTYITRDQRHEDSEHVDTEDSTSNLLGARNFAAAGLGTGHTTRTQEEGPFSDVNAFSPQEAIGLAITTNYPVPPSLRSRQSTPSLYSDSPQANGDADSFYDVDLRPPAVRPKIETRPAPPSIPRPPRSILRGTPPSSQFIGSEYRPLTPPDSVESQRLSFSSSSAGPSTPTGLGFATGSSLDHDPVKVANPLAPTLSPTAILTRRTLLDIRPRPSRDNVLTDASGRV